MLAQTPSVAKNIEGIAQQLQGGLDDDIRGVATLASIMLALLALFTNGRAEQLKIQQSAGIRALTLKRAVALLPDVALLTLTVGALLAMRPLFAAAFSLDEFGQRGGVLRSMFSLVWLGFVVLAAFQIWLLSSRLLPGLRLRRQSNKARRAARSDASSQ